MSSVLESRALECVRAYGITSDVLSDEEIASEIVGFVLPVADAEFASDLICYETVRALGVCVNCLCTDCACCPGCGAVDADVFGSHGYWCAL